MLTRREFTLAGTAAGAVAAAGTAAAEDREVIDARINLALRQFYTVYPSAREVAVQIRHAFGSETLATDSLRYKIKKLLS